MFVFILFVACGGKESDTGFQETSSEEGDSSEDTQHDDLDGAALYGQYCVPCHGEDARGVSNMGPDLQSALAYDDEYFVDVIRNGKGTMYPISVSQEEAYAIVNHIRDIFTEGR